MNTTNPINIDEYISSFPASVQQILHEVRATVRAAAPAATETIKYAMPTFMLKGNLVHFAAFKKHIGLYAVPTGVPAFEAELAAYKTGRGSVQFPLDQPIPHDLISRMVKFRVDACS